MDPVSGKRFTDAASWNVQQALWAQAVEDFNFKVLYSDKGRLIKADPFPR